MILLAIILGIIYRLFRRHTVHPAPPRPTKQPTKKPDEIKTNGPYGPWCVDNVITVLNNDDIIDEATQLNELKRVLSAEVDDNSASVNEQKSCEIDKRQSPISSSPSRLEKLKDFIRLPPLCDPFLPIDPHGRVYISWLLLVTFCYSYNAWCIALRATFPYQKSENIVLWMTADYLSDLVYIVDVVFVKPRLTYLHEGFWVKDTKKTRSNYRQKLQYKFDVISLVPLDVFYLVFTPKMVILRFPRLLKLQTFWEFHQAMDRVLSTPYVVRIGKMLFYIFYLIHLNACAYYAMSNHIGIGSNEWVYDGDGNAYIRCFYFATKTATSIGKNPKPENTMEYLFMTAAWLMGVFVFALLIGQIRDIYTTATRTRAEYKKTVDNCIRYLRELNMPAPLQRRVASWFKYTWSHQRCFDEERILNSLPYNMKRDVALEVHMTTLSKVHLFKNCSDSLLRDLVLQMRSVSYLPGDVVVRKGDVGHQMYIIKSGVCCVMSPDDKEVMAMLKEGSVFGEISLLGIEGFRRRTATVRSHGFSNLFALSRSDLDNALKQHKEAEEILRLRADKMIRENAARQAGQRMDEMQARRSASLHDDNAETRIVGNRRKSSGTSYDSGMRRFTSASAQSTRRRRLSVVSENKQDDPPTTTSQPPYKRSRSPLPTIVLSSD